MRAFIGNKSNENIGKALHNDIAVQKNTAAEERLKVRRVLRINLEGLEENSFLIGK